jgi:hypothetical protein
MRLDGIRRIAARAAKDAPESAKAVRTVADGYESGVMAIDARGDAASKQLKAKTFDAVRAPVSGW